MKAIDLAYLAGIIDGEGTLTVTHWDRKRRGKKKGIIKYLTPRLTISNTSMILMNESRRILEEICCVNVSKSNHVKKQKKHYKQCYQFAVSGKPNILKVVNLILPYLKVKKKHGELLKEFCELPDRSPNNIGLLYPKRAYELAEEIRGLNH